MIVLFALVLAALSAFGNVVVTKPGQTIMLECGDFSKSLTWRHGDELIVRSYLMMGSPIQTTGTSDLARKSRLKQANLEIRGVGKADAGRFTCENDRNQRQITLFVISVSASPSHVLQQSSEATLHCEVNGPNPGAVQWTKPDGSPHTEGSGSVHLKSVSRSDAGTWKCSFSDSGQTYSESLDIVVNVPPTPSPSNPGESVDVKEPSHNDPGPKQSPPRPPELLLGLNWWMWVAIGAGCLVVVVLLILVVWFFRRNRRKKRNIQQMKNGLHLRTPVQYCQCACPTAAAKPQQKRRREKPSAPRYEHPPGGVTQKAAHQRERRERE